MASAALLGLGSMAGSMVGGLFGNSAANEAAKTISNATNRANGTYWNMYGQNYGLNAPYMDAGRNAVNYLQYLLGFTNSPTGGSSQYDMNSILNKPSKSGTAGMDNQMGQIRSTGANSFEWVPGSGNQRRFNFLYNDGTNDVYQLSSGGKGTGLDLSYAIVSPDGTVNFSGQPNMPGSHVQQSAPGQGMNGASPSSISQNVIANDPGYQFRLSEGQKALERSAAAKGGLFSGGTLKDLTRYGQNFASNEFQNVYNRAMGLAGLGQNSTNVMTNAGQNTANSVAGNTMEGAINEANARASGYAALGKGIGGAINAGLNWAQMSGMGASNPGGGAMTVPADNYGYQTPQASSYIPGVYANPASVYVG